MSDYESRPAEPGALHDDETRRRSSPRASSRARADGGRVGAARSRRWIPRWRPTRSRCSRCCARRRRSWRSTGVGVVLTGRAEIDEAFRHPEIFSSNMSAVDLGNIRPLIPLQIDPPEHKKYRKILDPIFAPKQMALLEEPVTQLVNDLIDALRRAGRDRLRRRLLGAVPVAGVPHAARAPPRRAADVRGHEGRHHPSRPGHRDPRGTAPRCWRTSGRRPPRSTTTSTTCSTSARSSAATTSSACSSTARSTATG